MGEKTNIIDGGVPGINDPLPRTRTPRREPNDCHIIVRLRTIEYEKGMASLPSTWNIAVTVDDKTQELNEREFRLSGHYGSTGAAGAATEPHVFDWDITKPNACHTSISIPFQVMVNLQQGHFGAVENSDASQGADEMMSFECPSQGRVVLELDANFKEGVTQARFKFPFQVTLTCGQ